MAKKKREKAKKKKDKWKSFYKQALADLANLENKFEKEIVRAKLNERREIVQEFIDILDDFERILKNEKQVKGKETDLVNALDLLHEKILHWLQALDVSQIKVKPGSKPDLNKTEVIGVVNNGGDGNIVEVSQSGYVIGTEEIVIRPAKVIVSQNNAKGQTNKNAK